MAELLIGAALGVVFTELWDVVKKTKDRVQAFKSELRKLEKTLQDLHPKVEAIKRMDRKLKDSDQRLVQNLILIMKVGKELVLKCVRVSWFNILKKSSYHKKLMELDSDIKWFLTNVQLDTLLEVKKGRVEMNSRFDELSDKIERIVPDDKPAAPATPSIIGNSEIMLLLVLYFLMGMFGVITCFVIIIYRSRKAIICMLDKSESGIWMVIKDIGMMKTTTKKLNASIKSNSKRSGKSTRRLMKEGEMLISKSNEIGWWNFVTKWLYQMKMVELDNKILSSLHLQAQNKDKTSEPPAAPYHNEDLQKKKRSSVSKKKEVKKMDPTKQELNSVLIKNDNRFQLLEHVPPNLFYFQ